MTIGFNLKLLTVENDFLQKKVRLKNDNKQTNNPVFIVDTPLTSCSELYFLIYFISTVLF